MSFIDWFLMIVDFIEDIRFGNRYGFGSFVWKLGFLLCLFVTVLFFSLKLTVLGVIGIVGTVVCFVFSIRRSWQDMGAAQKDETKQPEQKQ